MTRSRTYTLAWWLLPLLVLRGLVPAGFMIDASHGGVSMVICSGGVYKTVLVDEQGTQSSQEQQAGEHQGTSHHVDSLCPFAVAAGGSPAPAVVTATIGESRVVDVVASDVAEVQSPFGPSRVQQSRAPPSFS